MFAGDTSSDDGTPAGFGGVPPAESDSFIGRTALLTEALRRLDIARLVTLVGMGGAGKTRLARHVARQASPLFSGDVVVVTLTDLKLGDDRLEGVIAAALGILDNSTTSMVARMIEHLRRRRMLLVLDNCEHLVGTTTDPGPVPRLLRTLLRAAPGLRVLATSRVRLGIDGEHQVAVPPLCTGAQPGCEDPEGDEVHEALRLLIDRAAAVGAWITPPDYPVANQVCRLLDGLPLAIELAAAQLDAMTLPELHTMLKQHTLRVLVDGSSEQHHHRALKAALDWSFNLLTAAEQRMWAVVSVFEGGFDLDAAQAVGRRMGIDAHDTFGLLARLVRKSVVTAQERDGRTRYRPPEVMRQYGLDLVDAARDADMLRQAHADYMFDVADRAAREWFGPDEFMWIRLLSAETPNMRAALEHFVSHPGQEHKALALAVNNGRTRFHTFAGTVNEARRFLDLALEYCEEPTELEVTALALGAWVALIQGQADQAGPMLARAKAIAEQLGCDPLPAPLLYAQGTALWLAEPDLAKAREAIPLLAGVAEHAQDPGDRHMARLFMSMSAGFLGDRDTAITSSMRDLKAAEDAQALWSTSWAVWTRALCELQYGDIEQATQLAQRCLAIQVEIGDTWGPGFALWLRAMIAARAGEHVVACQVFGGARNRQQLTDAHAHALLPFQRMQQETEARLRRELGDEEFEVQVALGENMSYEEVVVVALAQQPPAPDNDRAQPPDDLTAREFEVTGLVARGLRNREIAAQLHISHRTVEKHLEKILDKLGLANRGELVKWRHTLGRQPD